MYKRNNIVKSDLIILAARRNEMAITTAEKIDDNDIGASDDNIAISKWNIARLSMIIENDDYYAAKR